MKTFTTPKGSILPLLDMRGKPYLQVAHRLVWFREEHPDWSISTEFIEQSQAQSFVKATITHPSGLTMATAHKFEDKQGFADHREKAETGAIGRALALVGFGTQFCADDLDEGKRLADAPISIAAKSMQPEAGDGFTQGLSGGGYVVPFGKYAKKRLHEIPVAELLDYADYLERKAAEDPSKPMSANAVELITRIRELPTEPWDIDPLK